MNRKKLNILGIILCIIFLPVFIINMILIVKAYLKPNQVPDFLGYKPFIVLSGSMEDKIKIGDLVIVKKCDPSTLKTNDIIAYKLGNSVITHRIIEVQEKDGITQFLTKGDNNNTEDQTPVKFENVEGIYIRRIPKLGNIALFMQSSAGIVIFVSVPLILFIIYEIVQSRKEVKEEKERREQLKKELEELKQKKK